MEYYEDLAVGDTYDLGETTVTEAEIVEFAEQYDPQPFHIDPEAAEETMFGGLIASGWHTASLCMRLLVDNFLTTHASSGARGVDELRWKRPVRPGDTLSAELEILEKTPSRNPNVGNVRNRLTATNQDGEEVISFVGLGMFDRRDPEE